MGKAGGCAASQCEAIGRMVSLAWRSGVQARQVIKQLLASPATALRFRRQQGPLLRRRSGQGDPGAHGPTDDINARPYPERGACPECGGTVEHEGAARSAGSAGTVNARNIELQSIFFVNGGIKLM